jgi:biopolymer transport protein ExbD
MAFSTMEESGEDFNPEINTTPLVDVMLVLLIIFIITIPVMTHSVKLDLPRAQNSPNVVPPQTVNLSVDEDGKVYWNAELVEGDALTKRIAATAAMEPQPEIHIRGARSVPYEKVAVVMAAAQAGGLLKLGFVLDPAVK